MIAWKHKLELGYDRLEIMFAVGKSAAAYHHVSQVRKVSLSDMNISVYSWSHNNSLYRFLYLKFL